MRRVLVALWILFATGVLTRWWVTDLFQYLNFPQSTWDWLTQIYGVKNADQGGNLEILIGLGASFTVVITLTLLATFVYRRFFKK